MDINPDDRLTNNLRMTLGKAREVQTHLSNGEVDAAQQALSYVIAGLEHDIEWIRPEASQQVQPNKPFIKQFLP